MSGKLSRTVLRREGRSNPSDPADEGYMLDCELRPGSQHCQKGTVAFIEGFMGRLRGIQPGGRLLFRMDAGNDAADFSPMKL